MSRPRLSVASLMLIVIVLSVATALGSAALHSDAQAAPSAPPETLTLIRPEKDSWVDEGAPTIPYGFDSLLRVGLVRDLTSNLALTLSGKQLLILGAGGAVRGSGRESIEAEGHARWSMRKSPVSSRPRRWV